MTEAAHNPNSTGHPQTRDRFAAFGAVVRRHRKRIGLSQDKLAEKAGCDRQSVNRVENHAYAPSLHRLWLLADALGVPLSELMAETERLLPSPQDACKVGDPDPTPDDEPWCEARDQTSEFACTRRPHIRGQHVCGGEDGRVSAVWP